MARLNEPPAPPETVETLRRKFSRQNREVFRLNSIQSLKIRTLEIEKSALLAENIELGKEVIQLRFELEHSSKKNAIVVELKSHLEAKVQELSGFLTQLGDLDKNLSRRRSRLTSTDGPEKLTHQRRSTNFAEALAAQDGRLPTIVEDKCYPRRTLESREMQSLLEEACSDSPDIGPPPKSSFDCDENDEFAINVNTRQSYPPATRIHDDGEMIPGLLSGNFDIDTRRRRRSSLKYAEAAILASHETLDAPKTGLLEEHPIRTGAKRKLTIHNQEDLPLLITAPLGEEFSFSRKEPVVRKDLKQAAINRPLEDTLAKLVLHAPSQGTANGIPIHGSPRRILGPKLINADPLISSPKKHAKDGKDVGRADFREEESASKSSIKPRSRAVRPTDTFVVLPSQSEDIMRTAEIPLDAMQLEPNTPAAFLGTLSPESSRPSEAPQTSKDTPPPPDFRSSSSQKAEQAMTGRTSRRARSNVSYAEPSLVSKLRRPSETLVDAVGVAKDGVQQTGASKKTTTTSENVMQVRTVMLSRNDLSKPTPHKAKQTEPTSPLRDRQSSGEPSKHITDGDALTVNADSVNDPPPAQSASSAAIAKLISGSHKRASMSITEDPASMTAPAASGSDAHTTTTVPRTTSETDRRRPASSRLSTSSITRASNSRRQTLQYSSFDDTKPTSSSPQLSPLEVASSSSTSAEIKRAVLSSTTAATTASAVAGAPATADTTTTKRRAERAATRRKSTMS